MKQHWTDRHWKLVSLLGLVCAFILVGLLIFIAIPASSNTFREWEGKAGSIENIKIERR